MAFNNNTFVSDILKTFDRRITLAEEGQRLSEDAFDQLLQGGTIGSTKTGFKADAYSLGLFIPRPWSPPTHLSYLDAVPSIDLRLPAPLAPKLSADMKWESGGAPTGGFSSMAGSKIRNRYGICKVSTTTAAYDPATNPAQSGVTADFELDDCGLLLRFDGASISNWTFERVRAINARPSSDGYGLFKIRRQLNNLTFRDLYWCASPYKVHDDVEAVICLHGKTSDSPNNSGKGYLIERCYAFHGYSEAGAIGNMDGVSIEGGYNDGEMRDCYFAHFSDAGVDLKAQNWRMHNVVVQDARNNYKIWGASTRHGRIISINPKVAHMIVKVNTAAEGHNQFEIFECYGAADKPIFLFEDYIGEVRLTKMAKYQPGQVLARCNADAIGSRVVLPGGQTITLADTNPVLVP